MNQFKVVTRLSVAFGALLVLLGVVAFVGLSGMSKINDTLTNIVDRSTQEMTLAQTMRSLSTSAPLPFATCSCSRTRTS